MNDHMNTPLSGEELFKKLTQVVSVMKSDNETPWSDYYEILHPENIIQLVEYCEQRLALAELITRITKQKEHWLAVAKYQESQLIDLRSKLSQIQKNIDSDFAPEITVWPREVTLIFNQCEKVNNLRPELQNRIRFNINKLLLERQPLDLILDATNKLATEMKAGD